jgi:hypothetical protein
MLELKFEGYTYQQIAKKAGLSRQRIQQLLSPPQPIRNFVVTKYKGHCADCGSFVGNSGHIHHNNPYGEDRYDDLENLTLLCISCHGKSHKKPHIEIQVIDNGEKRMKWHVVLEVTEEERNMIKSQAYGCGVAPNKWILKDILRRIEFEKVLGRIAQNQDIEIKED